MQEATEISASLIALATAGLILIACGWPFMKLAFSGAAEPITRSDVVMVSVAVLLAAGIVALVFLDLVIYGRMKSIADYQHRAFAANTADEIRFALRNLLTIRNEIEANNRDRVQQYEQDHKPVSLDRYGATVSNDSQIARHSLFSSFAWVDDAGKQVIRASMTEGKPPLLDVSKRAYFQSIVRQKRLWDSNDRDDDRIHLRSSVFPFERNAESESGARKHADEFRRNAVGTAQSDWHSDELTIRRRLYSELQRAIVGLRPGDVTPVVRTADKFFVSQFADEPQRQRFFIESVRTLTNGQPEAVIAFPTGRSALPLLSITFPFVQLVERLGPPAMSYAVIDNAGMVLFHTDSERNGLEDVFTETDHTRQLRAAVIPRHEEFMDAKYWGEDVRVLITPLPDLPWTLLTFRDKRLLRTMNLEALVISLLLFL